jgi:hypothetical protein
VAQAIARIEAETLETVVHHGLTEENGTADYTHIDENIIRGDGGSIALASGG